MSYDWKKIFQEKTDEELYEIVVGKSMLPGSVLPIARKELENRNFDFNNIEIHKKAWELSKLLEAVEEYEYNQELIDEINRLTGELEKQNILKKDSPIIKDMHRRREKSKRGYKVMKYVVAGIIVIYLIIKLIQFIS